MDKQNGSPAIRPGTAGDIPAVLAMFDSAVAWLARHGRTGQWGGQALHRRSAPHRAGDPWAAAEALARGVGLLRVDCYAGDDGRLVAYYESCGFTRVAPFRVKDWPGMLLQRRL
ncbi:hypothetical protein [Nonomuraea sp. NPDC050783]|uniref:hypothetical protein n=1 Tax=Nonomuraea sp. NPDC050783 TaxID=3154634 RepID=UPI0034673C31